MMIATMHTWVDSWSAGAIAMDVMLAGQGPKAGLEIRRRRRYASLLAAARRTPFYRERFARHGERLEDQPPIDKSTLMGSFEDMLTVPSLNLPMLREFIRDPANIGRFVQGRYMVWESSGSSGVPGIFVQDLQAMAVYDALELLRRPQAPGMQRWLDPMRSSGRIAFVGAVGGHFASTVSIERLRHQSPVLADRLRCFSFLEPADQLARALEAWGPDAIATYPTQAALLADQADSGRLNLGLREIWTGGEGLSEPLRQRLQRSFGASVHGNYGASEFLALAGECEQGHLHLNADWAILESVDEHGRPVPEGEVGASVLLTNLANLAQPLIRYDLGDRVCMTSRCACGSPLPVVEVQGRVDDLLRVADTHGQLHRLSPLALSTVLEDDAGTFDFLLEQTGPRALRLTLPDGSDDASLTRSRDVLAAYLQAQSLGAPKLTVRRGATASAGRSGKRARIRRCLPKPPSGAAAAT